MGAERRELDISISNQSELPIYGQIREQIAAQVLSGEIPEGTVLPSIRKLAKELGVSVITTARAYQELEAEGYVATMQGKGSIVLPMDSAMLREQQLRKVEEALGTAIASCKRAGISKEELVEILETLWNVE